MDYSHFGPNLSDGRLDFRKSMFISNGIEGAPAPEFSSLN